MNTNQIINTIRLKSGIILLTAFYLCIPFGASAQDALRLEYIFSPSSPESDLNRFFDAEEIVDGVHVDTGQASNHNSSFNYVANVSVVINSDGNSATFTALDIDFVDTPVVIEDAFDLGFSGMVPYKVVITKGIARFRFVDVLLTPDLEFNTAQNFPFDLFLLGSLEIQGEILDFEFVSVPTNAVNIQGKFDIDGTLSNIALRMGLLLDLNRVPETIIFSNQVNGYSLELNMLVNLQGTLGRETVVPSFVEDSDDDGYADLIDNCPYTVNSDQTDTDSNGIGDACNDGEDQDGDEYADNLDNCPNDFNANQADADFDLIGDVCDPFPNNDDNEQAQCEADLTECLENPFFADADTDGEADYTDRCPDTPPDTGVDSDGCSLWQFCAAIDTSSHHGRKICRRSDWKNDEPLKNKGDCKAVKQGKGSHNYQCVPR